jgi:hypothetical protein
MVPQGHRIRAKNHSKWAFEVLFTLAQQWYLLNGHIHQSINPKQMRLLLLFLLLLPIWALAQITSSQKAAMFRKAFPTKGDSVHYERSFLLQVPKDTLFTRAENWMRSQKEYQQVLKRERILFETYELILAKAYIGFKVPYKSTKTPAANDSPTLMFIYTLKVYLKGEKVVRLMVDEVRIAGNLNLISIRLAETEKDTLYVEDYEKVRRSMAIARQTKTNVDNTALYQSYKLADARIKKDLMTLTQLLNKGTQQPAGDD